MAFETVDVDHGGSITVRELTQFLISYRKAGGVLDDEDTYVYSFFGGSRLCTDSEVAERWMKRFVHNYLQLTCLGLALRRRLHTCAGLTRTIAAKFRTMSLQA